MDNATGCRNINNGSTKTVVILAGLLLLTPLGVGSGSIAPETSVFLSADDVLATFEFNGNVEDTSGAGRHATLIGGTYESSEFGEGLRVGPGQPSGIEWNAHAELLEHPYTIEMVLTPDDTSSFRKVFSFHDNNDRGWYYNQEGFRAYPGGTIGSGQLVADERHYLAVVSTSASEVEVWFQGALLGSTSASFSAPPTHAVFFRDDTVTGRNEQLSGVIDAMRISNTTRTEQELQDVQIRLGSGPPGAPEDVEAVAGPGAGEITLTWDPPSTNGGAPVSGYLLYVADNQDGPFIEVALANIDSYVHDGLPDGHAQHYKLEAVNGAGYKGPESPLVSAVTFQPPSVPRDLLAETGPNFGQVTLSWLPPEHDGGSKIIIYEVLRADLLNPESTIAQVDGEETGFVDESCALSKCTYRVQAVNIAGAGGFSEPDSALGTALPET